jgi:hypothetical protein
MLGKRQTIMKSLGVVLFEPTNIRFCKIPEKYVFFAVPIPNFSTSVPREIAMVEDPIRRNFALSTRLTGRGGRIQVNVLISSSKLPIRTVLYLSSSKLTESFLPRIYFDENQNRTEKFTQAVPVPVFLHF